MEIAFPYIFATAHGLHLAPVRATVTLLLPEVRAMCAFLKALSLANDRQRRADCQRHRPRGTRRLTRQQRALRAAMREARCRS